VVKEGAGAGKGAGAKTEDGEGGKETSDPKETRIRRLCSKGTGKEVGVGRGIEDADTDTDTGMDVDVDVDVDADGKVGVDDVKADEEDVGVLSKQCCSVEPEE